MQFVYLGMSFMHIRLIEMSWDDFRALRFGLWIKSPTTMRDYCEKIGTLLATREGGGGRRQDRKVTGVWTRAGGTREYKMFAPHIKADMRGRGSTCNMYIYGIPLTGRVLILFPSARKVQGNTPASGVCGVVHRHGQEVAAADTVQELQRPEAHHILLVCVPMHFHPCG